MSSKQFKSASMKNLRNPATSFIVPLNFESLGKQYSSLFENNPADNMNDREKMKMARQCLHRYIFIICHTIQHFGHHLLDRELKLIRITCEETLKWMWRSETKFLSLEDYRQQILQLLRICTPLMKRLFHTEQQNVIERNF